MPRAHKNGDALVAAAGLMALLCLPASAQDAARDACMWRTANFNVNQTVRISLIVRADHTGCGRTMRVGSRASFERLRIVRRARNGAAAIAGVSGYGYRPNPGFRGDDSFTLQLDLIEGGVRGTATIEVNVTVR
jgi:hypothetical protein